MNPLRRHFVLAGALVPVLALARETPLREVIDMREAYASGSAAKPFVLLASIKGCPFCEFVRRSYLVPMNAEGRINAWQLSIDRNAPVVGFSGQGVAARFKGAQLGVRTTPTVLFLDDKAKALAEPLIGVVSSEVYGAMLEDRLQTAKKR